jgi:hypothetical protein
VVFKQIKLFGPTYNKEKPRCIFEPITTQLQQYFFEKTKKCKKGFLLVHAQRTPPEALHSWFYILKKLRKRKKKCKFFGGDWLCIYVLAINKMESL